MFTEVNVNEANQVRKVISGSPCLKQGNEPRNTTADAVLSSPDVMRQGTLDAQAISSSNTNHFHLKEPVMASLVVMVTGRDMKEDRWADGGKTEQHV
jgi:hypothetical protein